MSDTIVTRPLVSQDVEETLELMRAALGEPPLLKRTPELFAWKHFDNPFGRSVALLAEADSRIVGLRTMMRWDLINRYGETVRCVRPVDTATHPDFQRQGIFRRLTEEALEVATEQGIDLVFNTPNEKSGAGYLSMGWKQVGPVGAMVRPRLGLLSPARGRTDEPAQFLRHPKPAWPLAVTDRQPQGLRTPRTPEYLLWRFASHPAARYCRVEGEESVAVVRSNFRNNRREVVVADVFGARPASALRRTARQSHADYAGTWFSPGTPERAAALRSGYIPVPGVAPLTLMARPLREFNVDLYEMGAWDLSISDLELL